MLDFGWWSQPDHTPLPALALLPSLAAAAMERMGRYDPQMLAEAGRYAIGAFVTDFLLGPRDAAAVARLTTRLSALTGLDPETVKARAGRLGADEFARLLFREEGRIASPYDARITGLDPAPYRIDLNPADPMLDALTAPLTSAMLAHHAETLTWSPKRPCILLNEEVDRAWAWGGG